MMSLTVNKLESAFWRALKWLESTAIHYVENCISCGICYEACPLYHIDEKYTPATIAEWFRRFYRRYMTVAGRLLGRLAHAYPVTESTLLKAREYVYRCTNCGLCYLVCAAGVDSGYLAQLTKVIIREAEYTPKLLLELEKLELEEKYNTSKVAELYNSLVDEIKKAIGRDPPIEEPDKTVLIPVTIVDLIYGKDAIVSMVRILEKIGLSWTISRPIGIRPPIAYVTGAWNVAYAPIRKIYALAERLKSRILLVLDAGYPYEVLRFEAPYIAEVEQPCAIMSPAELIEEYVERGFLYFRKVPDVVTWHDPCMALRRSGVETPKHTLEKVALFAKPKKSGKYATCCGGGSHMFFMHEEVLAKLGEVLEVDLVKLAERDRFVKEMAEISLKIAEMRARELVDTGAKTVLTMCYSCIYMIEKGLKRIGMPEVSVKHITTFLADRLA